MEANMLHAWYLRNYLILIKNIILVSRTRFSGSSSQFLTSKQTHRLTSSIHLKWLLRCLPINTTIIPGTTKLLCSRIHFSLSMSHYVFKMATKGLQCVCWVSLLSKLYWQWLLEHRMHLSGLTSFAGLHGETLLFLSNWLQLGWLYFHLQIYPGISSHGYWNNQPWAAGSSHCKV
mgnify:CR=1 FL=1